MKGERLTWGMWWMNERSIEVHSTDVIWKLCTAQGKGQAQAWCEGSVAVLRLKGILSVKTRDKIRDEKKIVSPLC